MKKITTLIIATIFSVAGFAQANIADARAQGVGSTVTITGVVTNGDQVTITAMDKNDKEIVITGDYCLISVGRRPYTDGLKAENADVADLYERTSSRYYNALKADQSTDVRNLLRTEDNLNYQLKIIEAQIAEMENS